MEIAQRVYCIYEKRLQQSRAIDFGGLISVFTTALEKDAEFRHHLASKYEHLLVDEFQDTNHAQFRLVKSLCSVYRNVCVVGDDDQSIYRWRGADRRNILDFRSTFPDAEVIKLEQNYRSTKRILRAAHAVIERNQDREPKELWTDNDEGEPIAIARMLNEREEARGIVMAINSAISDGYSLSDIAVFYRIHAQSRALEEAFSAVNLRYRIVGGVRFYDRAEVKDLLGYLRVLDNPQDDVSVLRIINTPARGIGKSSIGRLTDAAVVRGIGVWDALCDDAVLAQFSAGAYKKLRAFVRLIDSFRRAIDEGVLLSEIASRVLNETGYLEDLRQDDSAEADARIQNVNELVSSIEQFELDHPDATLADYLQNITLQTSADEGAVGESVTMMTVHAAKGLEFPVVIVAGMEENLFPFKGVDPWEDPEELEEERRLAYVAFTRAQERLLLTHTSIRRVFGQERIATESRFLRELPAEDVWRAGRSNSGSTSSNSIEDATEQYEADDRSLDYSDSDLDVETLVRRGMRVTHPKFGIGEVREIIAGSPPRARVRFDGWGERRIIMSYLRPA
ncbi:MAG: 3'-5' exonuclease [Polyangiales bacterium]